jgi:hypothetical protein
MNKKFRLGAIMIALVSAIIGIGVTPILQQQSFGALLEGEKGLTLGCPSKSTHSNFWRQYLHSMVD